MNINSDTQKRTAPNMASDNFKDQCSDMTKEFNIQIPWRLAERVEDVHIVEINFKCDHCPQEFREETFNIAAFFYGVFILLGKEKKYVGLTCPNCLQTILIKENIDLVNYTKQNLSSGKNEMSFLIYLVSDKDEDHDEDQLIPFCSKLRYHSSVFTFN